MSIKTNTSYTLQQSTLWLMAIACGLCAGANYFAQPLLHSIETYFHITTAQAQITITCAQVSYALGLLFLVPLGDLVKKHLFIPILMGLAAIGLLISAFAINIYMLWIGTIMTGLFSVAAQVLIPLSAAVSAPEKSGAIVGFLMSGLLVGILISTSLAGLLSNLFGWNAIYIFSAMTLLIVAMLLKQRLPILSVLDISYKAMFASMANLIQQEKRLVLRALIGAFSFGSMSTLFATMAILLAKPPFSLSDFYIGVIGLTGLIGAFFAQHAGKLADQGYAVRLTLIGAIIICSSWGILFFSQWYIAAFLLGFTLINLGLAMQHTTNLNIIYKLRDDAKARINSIYMTLYFIGAASGSALGTWSWNSQGWWFTCAMGLILALISAICACIDFYLYEHKNLKSKS